MARDTLWRIGWTGLLIGGVVVYVSMNRYVTIGRDDTSNPPSTIVLDRLRHRTCRVFDGIPDMICTFGPAKPDSGATR